MSLRAPVLLVLTEYIYTMNYAFSRKKASGCPHCQKNSPSNTVRKLKQLAEKHSTEQFSRLYRNYRLNRINVTKTFAVVVKMVNQKRLFIKNFRLI